MRSSTWRLEDLRNVILNLGFVGENLHTRQIFDCKKMFDQYPNASVSMTVTPPEGEPYPGTIERDGDLVIWDVRDSDLVAEGDGEIQIVFTQEPHIARSYNARTHICRSQVPTGSIPSGLDDYITRADQLLDQVEDTFPAGGTTGQVLAKKSDTDYDTEWVDQGGGTEDYDELENRPQIGGITLTGNKTLHDLGAASEADVEAKYTKPETGIPASDLAAGVIPDPEDLIDDNAGSGDTNKVWSADKSHELLTEINSKQDAPSATGTAGQVLGLDSNLAPVWMDQSGGGSIPDNSITQKKLSFAELVLPGNLFDYSSEDMCVKGKWYYETTVGNTVVLKGNQYTTGYAAIKFPVYNVEKITIGTYPSSAGTGKNVYWVGAVDENMKLLNYTTFNTPGPVTYTIPSGTVYALVSYSIGASSLDTTLPKVMIVSGETISEYTPYFTPYYNLMDCKANVEDVQKIQTIVGSGENTVKWMLPDTYDVVVNDTIQIFFKGIINAPYYEMFYIDVDCESGKVFKRYFELTPSSTGNITATFILYGINHNVIDTKTVTFAVHAKPSSPATQKNILCVGDSLTVDGIWVKELYRRLTGSDGTPTGDGLTNVNFIGTRVKDGVNFEGYGGWTYGSFNSEMVGTNAKVITCSHDKTSADQHSIYKDSANYQWKLETIESGSIKILAVTGTGTSFPATGTLTWVSGGVNHSDIVYTASTNAPGNPFWINGSVDFDAYATAQGVSTIDYVLVLLGWNGSGYMTEASFKNDAQTFLSNVHNDFPDAKIILLGLEIPSIDGLGVNYSADVKHGYYTMMQHVFRIDKWYKDLVDDNENIYPVNLSGQFDTEYNMQTIQKQVNSRNATTITFQSNGIHPATSGYYQIADAFYRKLVDLL